MNKKTILIFLILIFSIILIIYFKIMKTDIISEKTEENLPARQEVKVDLVEMENSYTEEVKNILSEYDKKIKNAISERGIADSDIEDIATSSELSYQERLDLLSEILDLKDRLLDLKVPTYFKALHLELVLAFSKMESFIESDIEEERINALNLIEQARNSYDWLFE
ncbi:hypothetical protein L6267_04835 [Candidatus Parcubacteria bacterium]|nr:hypothetical protein [Candidatus Parcubacteria bacterium]